MPRGITLLQLVGQPVEDIRIIADFLERWDRTLPLLVGKPIPPEFFRPREVLEGIPRVTDVIQGDRPRVVHPAFLLAGEVDHVRWAFILSYMYPGGRWEVALTDGLVQGHPDFLLDSLVLEVKTVGEDRWQRCVKRPERSHVRQLLEYLRLASRDVGLLVYENRSSLDLWVYVIRKGRDDQNETIPGSPDEGAPGSELPGSG